MGWWWFEKSVCGVCAVTFGQGEASCDAGSSKGPRSYIDGPLSDARTMCLELCGGRRGGGDWLDIG